MEAVFCGLGGARLFCEPLLLFLLENTETKQADCVMHRTYELHTELQLLMN